MTFWGEMPDRGEMLWLRDALSRGVAKQMWRELSESGEIQWTDNIRIRPTGLMLRSVGKLNHDSTDWHEITFRELGESSLFTSKYLVLTTWGRPLKIRHKSPTSGRD